MKREKVTRFAKFAPMKKILVVLALFAIGAAGCSTPMPYGFEGLDWRMRRAKVTYWSASPFDCGYFLNFHNSDISDLSFLDDIPISVLDILGSNVTDLSPLKGKHLCCMAFSPQNITNGIETIRGMSSLNRINGMPADDFWLRYDAHKGDWIGINDTIWLPDRFSFTLSVATNGHFTPSDVEASADRLSDMASRHATGGVISPVVLEIAPEADFSKIWIPLSICQRHGVCRFTLLFPDNFRQLPVILEASEGLSTRDPTFLASALREQEPVGEVVEVKLDRDRVCLQGKPISLQELEKDIATRSHDRKPQAKVIFAPSGATTFSQALPVLRIFVNHELRSVSMLEEARQNAK